MSPLSPKWQFKLNRWRNRWNEWRAGLRQTEQAVTAANKLCPSCRAFVPRRKAVCPYCGQRLQVFGTGPTGKLLKRAMPATVPVTGILILMNFVLFIIEYSVSGIPLLTHLMSGPSGAATMRLGESLPLGYLVLHSPYHAQYWRWITACFLHAGILHIGFNMWALYDIGQVVESFYGGAKLLFFYILTGIFGYLVSSFFGYVSLGASGAIFGILGVMIAYGVRRSHTAQGRELRGLAVRWAIYALVLAFVIPHVDNAAHLGGLAAGFVLGMIVGDGPPLREDQVRRWRVVQWAVVIVVAAAFYFMATWTHAPLV
ncbi:MAG: rhomboid family intramembrane serine protease [Terriglobales bacterium]